ncbi:hypothetical protein CVT26_011717 [Gymnopilus dilepis]|uniref:Uncharacterized protein n=1 Tax=Gymnopilus dilepis TaxID=231916 RepID=A0A409X6Q3_9AGAR|nr:hypothetical protein CVT26_011717 [Gymnopilus dilepis]
MSQALPKLPALNGVTPAQKQKRIIKPTEKVKAQAATASQGGQQTASKRRLSEGNPAVQRRRLKAFVTKHLLLGKVLFQEMEEMEQVRSCPSTFRL